jgi:hypothetical protein
MDINNVTETLETLIDKHGLLHVVTGLQAVCDEKAAHVDEAWQDKPLARKWNRAANAVYTLARKIDACELP